METTNKNLFTQFPDQSKVWLYQSNRALNADEIKDLEHQLLTFVKGWAAHGNELWATAKVLNPYFAVVAVNDSLVPPSGCSVDASVQHIKEIGEEMGINFFDRMILTIQDGEVVKQIHFSDLEKYDTALIFDPLITSLGELRAEWPRPIRNSSFAHMVG